MDKLTFKNSIENKRLTFVLIPYLILCAILFSVDIGLCIEAIFHFPKEYLPLIIFGYFFSQIFTILAITINPISIFKRKKEILSNISGYIEYKITLPEPIDVGFNLIQFNIVLDDDENNIHITKLSNCYSQRDIDGNQMLIAYNKEIDSIIFIKNI